MVIFESIYTAHLLNCQQYKLYHSSILASTAAGFKRPHPENLLRPQGLALVKAGALELLQHLAEPMAEAAEIWMCRCTSAWETVVVVWLWCFLKVSVLVMLLHSDFLGRIP